MHPSPAGHTRHDPSGPPSRVGSSAAADHCPACVTAATGWNVTRRSHQPPGTQPLKDLAVFGRDPDHRGGALRLPCQRQRWTAFGRAESGKAPPCMRWRGLTRPRRTGWPVARPCRRRAPSAGARYPCQGPVSRLLPRLRGRPQVVPVSNGKTFLLPPRAPRKCPRPAISGFSAIHEVIPRKRAVIRISRRLSTGLFTAYPQAPGVSQRTPEPSAPMQSAELSQRLQGTQPVAGSDAGADGSRVADDPAMRPEQE